MKTLHLLFHSPAHPTLVPVGTGVDRRELRGRMLSQVCDAHEMNYSTEDTRVPVDSEVTDTACPPMQRPLPNQSH